MAKGRKAGGGAIVIRREEVVGGGHHGGAWKVAYADFVTAMMAFFLLMWLLNATTTKQRQGIADYFSPTSTIAISHSGNGGVFGGHTPNDEGPLASDRAPPAIMNAQARPVFDVDDDDSDTPAAAAAKDTTDSEPNAREEHQKAALGATTAPEKPGDTQAKRAAAAAASAAAKEGLAFDAAAKQIEAEVARDPAMAALARQISVDVTREGLRIQLLDADKQAMFATGSADPNDRARALLVKIAPVLMRLPEKLSIVGHTDATPFRGGDRTNWELSADRANATRRILADAGVPPDRVATVAGRADRDPLLPADPLAAANRRIAITVLRSAPPPAAPAPAAPASTTPAPAASTPAASAPASSTPASSTSTTPPLNTPPPVKPAG